MQPEPAKFVFLDVEATGLDHGRHEMTEVAWIVRHEDGHEEERQFFPFHTTDGADPDALELTRYEERIAPRRRTPMKEWLPLFLRDANRAIIVGAVPDFDVRHLEIACRKLGHEPTWDHHLLDVETLALPLIATGPERPRSLTKTCEALGITFDRDQAHGALYDVRMAKAVFDRVWELLAALGNDEQPVAAAAAPPSTPAPLPEPEPPPTESAAPPSTPAPLPEPKSPPTESAAPTSENVPAQSLLPAVTAESPPPAAVTAESPPPVAAAPPDEPPAIAASPPAGPPSQPERPSADLVVHAPDPAKVAREWPVPPGRAADDHSDEGPEELEPEVYERAAQDAAAESDAAEDDEPVHEQGSEGGPEPMAPEPVYRPIRPLDAPLPPRDPRDRATSPPSSPAPPPRPTPAPPSSSPPAPRRKASPLVEEAVTVLPPEGVEDSLFGARHKKVGHPGRRASRPADDVED